MGLACLLLAAVTASAAGRSGKAASNLAPTNPRFEHTLYRVRLRIYVQRNILQARMTSALKILADFNQSHGWRFLQ